MATSSASSRPRRAYQGTFTVDEHETPYTIDIAFKDGPAKGKRLVERRDGEVRQPSLRGEHLGDVVALANDVEHGS